MSYDWQNEADREGGQRAPKVPTGDHNLIVVQIIHEKRNGIVLESRHGDPQMLLIFMDQEDREAAQLYTLSERAGWTLAKVMGAMQDLDLSEVQRQGIEPRDFADPAIAKRWLYGKMFRGHVEWKRGEGGRTYSEVTPLRSPSPFAADPDEVPSDSDEVPF